MRTRRRLSGIGVRAYVHPGVVGPKATRRVRGRPPRQAPRWPRPRAVAGRRRGPFATSRRSGGARERALVPSTRGPGRGRVARGAIASKVSLWVDLRREIQVLQTPDSHSQSPKLLLHPDPFRRSPLRARRVPGATPQPPARQLRARASVAFASARSRAGRRAMPGAPLHRYPLPPGAADRDSSRWDWSFPRGEGLGRRT